MDRRKFLKISGIGAAGMLFSDRLTGALLKEAQASTQIKPITGSWIEFQHHLPAESEYWDEALRKFTSEQWRRKIFEMKEIGMEYLVLMSVALFEKALYPSALAPQMELGSPDPLEDVLSAADECGIKFFISNDYWGDLKNAENMMTDKDIKKIREDSMIEIALKYGHHKSFYGWYFPNEAYLQPYFSESSIQYINECDAFARTLTPHCVNLIAPYYIINARDDEKFVKQLERLNIDIIAYQDGVGVNHTKLGEAGKFFSILRKAHDKAGRAKLWADMELFYFESGTHGNLLPADFSKRILRQMEDISPYVDRILCYQYIGVMNKPNTDIIAGSDASTRLYEDYRKWLSRCRR